MKLFASDREVVEEAFAGDVVGWPIRARSRSATRCATVAALRYDRIPSFEPEHFSSVRNVDTGGYKSFQKGIAQLAEEGAIQVFYAAGEVHSEPVFAAVGELQFEVAKYRLAAEYNVKTQFSRLPYSLARRVVGDASAGAAWPSSAKLVEDASGTPFALFESDWSLRLAEEWNAVCASCRSRPNPNEGDRQAMKQTVPPPATCPPDGNAPAPAARKPLAAD
jgi:peptide chain release factor 3